MSRDQESLKLLKFESIAGAVLAAVLLGLTGLALSYSWHTSFRLIDDYVDWTFLRDLSNWEGLREWFIQNFMEFSSGRYRPTFDLYNVLTWGAFGSHFELHHMARWAMKAGAAAFFALSLLSVPVTVAGAVPGAVPRVPRVPGTGGELPSFIKWTPLWLFLFIYAFFPINPEAALAPVELETVFFLSALNFLIVWRWRRWLTPGGRGRDGLFWHVGLLLATAGLAGSKEVNVAPLAATLVVVGVMEWVCFRSFRRLIWLAPMFLILAHTCLKVASAARGGGYGTSPITPELMLENFRWMTWSLYSGAVFPVPMTLFLLGMTLVALVRVIREWSDLIGARQDPYQIRDLGSGAWAFSQVALEAYWILILAQYTAMFLITATSWAKTAHYLYPLVFLGAAFCGVSARMALSSNGEGGWTRPFARVAIPLLCLYFAGYNAYNFLYQFATQHYCARIEKDVLRFVEGEVSEGRRVMIQGKTEFERNAILYFDEFRFYFGPRSRETPPKERGASLQVRYRDLFVASRESYMTAILGSSGAEVSISEAGSPVQAGGPGGGELYRVGREKELPGWDLVTEFQGPDPGRDLKRLKRLSAKFRFEKEDRIFHWVDGGAHYMPDYPRWAYWKWSEVAERVPERVPERVQ